MSENVYINITYILLCNKLSGLKTFIISQFPQLRNLTTTYLGPCSDLT